MFKAPSAVEKAIKKIKLDRPNWKTPDELIDLWEEEFKGVSAETMEDAASHFIRTYRGMVTISAFHDSIAAVRVETQPIGDDRQISSTQAAIDLMEKHPWYDPDASMAQNLANCQAYRGTKYWQEPGSIGAALSSIIRDK